MLNIVALEFRIQNSDMLLYQIKKITAKMFDIELIFLLSLFTTTFVYYTCFKRK